MEPAVILVLSGKRKSGKDYVANLLFERLESEKCIIIRISAPLKYQYAKENGLDYERLLDSSNYKELHRKKMIAWGEEKRKEDPSFFCKHAISQADCGNKVVWIVSDARRHSDLVYLKNIYQNRIKTVRITATEETRKERGWVFQKEIDNAESECDLDDYCDWDCFVNNDNEDELENDLKKVTYSISNLIDSR